jgi:transposase
MMHDLTDEPWAVIQLASGKRRVERCQLMLQPPNTRGRPRADDRKTLNGILYVLRTGCA